MVEHFFACPYCGAKISMLIDLSFSQKYIEDCEVCCNPIEVEYSTNQQELTEFQANSIEQ